MSEDNETIRLHLSVGNVTIEVEGESDEAELKFDTLRQEYIDSADFAEDLTGSNPTEKPIDEETTDGGQKQISLSETADSARKQESLSELYQSSEDTTKRDRILLIGHYLEEYEGQDDFTRAEVEEAAKDSKVELGANVSRDFSKQIEDGYLTKVGERDGEDTFYLTRSGEEYVAEEILVD